jgi:hypothetical protein
LEIKFCPNWRIFVVWRPFWIQNGHHSKPKWSPYGARFCPTKFSETDEPIFTKLHRKVDPHLKRCIQVLEFSKWLPFQNGRHSKMATISKWSLRIWWAKIAARGSGGRIIITRFNCVWTQTQKSPKDPGCGCQFHHYQPIPHFKILLDINFH